MVDCREWIGREFGKVIYTLLYSKWIINKDILYSTWKSTHVMCQPGWEGGWGRMDTCMCMAESLCCSETATTLPISYTPIQNNKFKVWKKKKKKGSFFHINVKWRNWHHASETPRSVQVTVLQTSPPACTQKLIATTGAVTSLPKSTGDPALCNMGQVGQHWAPGIPVPFKIDELS